MEISHPDRVIFPDAGLTKADVVGHYQRVGDAVIVFLRNHPLTLQRFPKGIQAKGFMRKNAGKQSRDRTGNGSLPFGDISLATRALGGIAATRHGHRGCRSSRGRRSRHAS